MMEAGRWKMYLTIQPYVLQSDTPRSMWRDQIGGIAMRPEVRETGARNVNDIEVPQFKLRGGVIVGGPYVVQTAVFFSSSLPHSTSTRLGFVCH
jgi:hypothetical protein